jgi:hypothetical protein
MPLPCLKPAPRDYSASTRGRACVDRARGAILIACAAPVLLAGCGYTVIRGAPASGTDDAAQSDRGAIDRTQLPPGHPKIDQPEDWIGQSFLDHFLGADEPLRFESMRARPGAGAPSEKAIITYRIVVGGPTLADIWQIRMDAFGWVTAAYWAQGAAGPQLDDLLATRREEFRLEPQSEHALRAMAILLLPQSDRPGEVRLDAYPRVPRELWPFEDPGRIEIDYRIETLDRADPSTWPGGRVIAPLDITQLLIATWDDAPPPELRRAARELMESQPLLVNVALLAEAIALALEVEGSGEERLDLPLRVGR